MKAPRIITSIITAALLAFTASPVTAAVPNLLNYQGRVAVSGINFDGAGQFRFALVNTEGTTTFWSNDATSTAGSEPTAAVALTVTKGLYSVALGDAALTNMTAIPVSVFSQPDLRLRVWFDDGTHGSHLLTPDSRITPNGYLPDNAVTSSKIAPGAIDGTQLASGINITGSLTGNATTATNATNLATQLGTAGTLNNNGNPVDWSELKNVPTTIASGSVITGADLANAATSTNIPSTIVKRDGSGNFTAGTIFANSFSGDGSGLYGVMVSSNDIMGTITNGKLQNSSITVNAGSGLTGGGVVPLGATTGLALSNTGVSPGTYSPASITVDAQGRVTNATTSVVSFTQLSGTVSGSQLNGANGFGLTNLNGTNLASGSVPLTALAPPARPKFDRQFIALPNPQITGADSYLPGMTLTTKNLDESGTYTITFRGCVAYYTGGGAGNYGQFMLNIAGSDVPATASTFSVVATINSYANVSINYVASNVAAGSMIKVRFRPLNGTMVAYEGQLVIEGVPTSEVR